MSGKRFQARAKTVQKLGRDGLVERNMATGEEKRVSQRTADISFGPERTVGQAAGHHVVQRGGGDPAAPVPTKKRHKQPRPVQQTAEEAAYTTQAPASTSEFPVSDTPSMRMAADTPMLAPSVTVEDTLPTPPASRKRQTNRKKSKQKQAAKHTPDAAHTLEDRPIRSAGDAPIQNRSPGEGQKPPVIRSPRPVEGGGRLKYETAEDKRSVSDGRHSADARNAMKKRLARRFAPDATQPASSSEQRSFHLMEDGGERLHFEGMAAHAATVPDIEPPKETKQAIKKRQVIDHAASITPSETTGEHRTSRLMDDGGECLHFEAAVGAVSVPVIEQSEGTKLAVDKRQAVDHAATIIQPATTGEQHLPCLTDDGGGRLHFEAEVDHDVTAPAVEQSKGAKKAGKKHHVMDHAANIVQSTATVEQHPSRLIDDGGGRLHDEPHSSPHLMDDSGGQLNFEAVKDGAAPVPDLEQSEGAKQAAQKRRVKDQTATAIQPAATDEPRPSRRIDDSSRRLHFEGAKDNAVVVSDTEQSQKAKRTIKNRQVENHAAAAVKPETEPPPSADGKADTHQRDSPQPEPKAPELAAVPDDRAAYKKWQAARLAAHSVAPISLGRRRLQFEDETPPQADSPPAPAPKEDAPLPNQKYDRAVRRVERTEKQVEQARAALPVKRRLSIQPEPDSKTGKLRRLHFEQEVLPEYRRPSLPAHAGDMVKTTAVMKIHGKIRESERDNVAVEAAHKSELFAEQGVGRALRWEQNRRRSKPYRALRQAERRAARENSNLAWQTALRDNPELQRKHTLAKWMQKQKIKRKYAQAAHEAKQAARHTRNTLNTTKRIVRAILKLAVAHKSLMAVVALLILVVVFFSAGTTSCTAMLSGFQSSYISASYMANEQDICNADLYYTELETDLQINIDKTEENYPGYDEYRYNIGEISHNPYELMGYLSTKFNVFTFEGIKAELDRLFGEQYKLTREVDDNGILRTTLTVRLLSDVILENLTPSEQTERYSVYMQTLGNRQAYGNPFDFPWLGYVSSDYGYRVHPISGEKNLHRGVDIAVAQGTPIKAIQDGRVISAGEAGSYGLCVVIEDDKGYQSRYAHCSSLSVSVGQEVKRGDVIAAVGSTGQSTGPHLHLEIMLNGEYLNPYYFVDTGGVSGGAIPGTPGGPVIPDYPGEPPTDETFAAMLAEAEKYLGYPYVWGGSSPSTSFDCSGFVSWVVNHSGWSVGRQTATGLYNLCTPVSMENAKPGDLIFFAGTYSTNKPVTHVGIYVGNGQMIHCGNPISYANINSNYWQQHFYAMGRLP